MGILDNPSQNSDMLELPVQDVWGALARKDSRIGQLAGIGPANLAGENIVASRQALAGTLKNWAGDQLNEANVIATFSLPLNGRALVRHKMCCLLTYEGLFELGEDSDLVFVPFIPRFTARQGLVWRKSSPNRQTQAFLDEVRTLCDAKHR